MSQSPSFAMAANNLAWMYVQSGSDLDVALGLAQKAVELQPDFVEAIDTLAWVQYRKGLYAGAIPLLQDCVAKAPQSPLYHFHLGMVLLGSGDRKRGSQELQAALRLNLSPEDAEQAAKALTSN
jgi:tetratricopeptide (TPR) repeat protein